MNIMKAIMIKLITDVMKAPYLMSTPRIVSTMLLKSVLPNNPMNGEITSLVRDVTIA